MKKIMTIIGVLALLLVLLLGSLGVWAYYKFLYTEPLDEAELAELAVDWDVVTGGNWSPWYDAGDGVKIWNPAASYNAWLASVPEEDKAWPLMVDAFFEHEEFLWNEHFGTLPTDPARWEILLPDLATAEADALHAQIMVAFEKPVLGAGWSDHWDPYEHAGLIIEMESDPEAFDPGPLEFDPTANVAMMDMMMAWLGRHRNFVNFVESKAAYELEQGDTEVFVRSMEGLLESSDLCKEIPTMISMLVETAIENVAIRTIDWGVTNHRAQFDAQHLERLESAIAEHANADYLWQGEALQFHDTARRLSDSDGKLQHGLVTSMQGGGNKLTNTATSLPAVELHASSQRMMYLYNMILESAGDQAKLPWDGTSGKTDALFQGEKDKLNIVTTLMIEIMLPAFDRSAARIRQHTQEVLGVRLGIAAHRFFERHNRFPESIDDFDDDLIAFNPVDAFNGEVLLYRIVDGKPLVYSVGDDRIDDGGQIRWDYGDPDAEGIRLRRRTNPEWIPAQRAAELRLNVPERVVGDWVLFPMPPDDPKPLKAVFDRDWDLRQDGSYEDVYGEEPAPESDG